jgi:hypothetical protein
MERTYWRVGTFNAHGRTAVTFGDDERRGRVLLSFFLDRPWGDSVAIELQRLTPPGDWETIKRHVPPPEATEGKDGG